MLEQLMGVGGSRSYLFLLPAGTVLMIAETMKAITATIERILKYDCQLIFIPR